MYRTHDKRQLELENFHLPFGGHLNPRNRWIQLTKLIPWEEFEEKYACHFSEEEKGAPAKPFRTALGALLIKEKLGITDRETVEQIRENPYLQYVIGMEGYRDEAPFDASMMVHFRKRITPQILQEINERIHEEQIKKNEKPKQKTKENENAEGKNKGKLIVDASCTPADIRYPTDVSLLNEAREKTEEIIDILHAPLKGKEKKVRTYRERARKEYVKVAKKRKPNTKTIRRGIRKQLQYVRRNLGHIKELSQKTSLTLLDKRMYRNLLVIQKLYEQQQYMYDTKTHRIADRIVSISQPHVRPIVRGKEKAEVEFGAKISVSMVDGYTFLEKLSWDAYNESNYLIEHIEAYKKRCGYYPESVHVDKIYRNRENRRYCKDKGIRISGPPLGRPKKDEKEQKEVLKETRLDELIRIAIEGKLGNGKRRYGWARIMAKLKNTSETAIGVTVLVMNMEKIVRDLLLLIFSLLQKLVYRRTWGANYA
jgi:hypothetical protein